MTQGVLITGCNGGIGKGLVKAFHDAGWFVVGLDLTERDTAVETDHFIKCDLADFVSDEKKLNSFAGEVRASLGERPLAALVNNAAIQILGGVKELLPQAILDSFTVNTAAPYALVKAFATDLEESEGAVVNIGSVHAQATKPQFVAYATSKAALHGLTRALAIDLGPKVRVNTLAPAATETSMLKAGFKGNEEGYAALKDAHPLKRVASPDEIAGIALFLASKDARFLTGATIYADGGVLSRLYDPT